MTGCFSDDSSNRRIAGFSITVLVCLVLQAAVPIRADEAPVTAIELLSTFSGEDATAHASLFRFTEDRRITGIELHAAGIEATTARYSGQDVDEYKEVNNLLRITTADGFEGVSGVDSYYFGRFSDEHLLELQEVAADLVSFRSLDPVEVRSMIERTRPDTSDPVRASIDIALWDLAARRAGLPLYELLGAKRHSIEPYASLPFYEALPRYIDAVYEYAELGFTTFKFHVWGELDKDLQLVALVQETFADSPYRFMIDLESAYGYEDALALGKAMDAGSFVLFEAPVDDALLEDYTKLRAALAVDILPAGYTHYSPDFMRRGIDAGAWDAGRFDATTVGGITDALELLIIANDADLPIEIQSLGHSLTQAVNLHLMLANERTRYFESPMPKEAFEFGMENGNLIDAGNARPPDGPGLGIRVDWGELESADFYDRVADDFSDQAE